MGAESDAKSRDGLGRRRRKACEYVEKTRHPGTFQGPDFGLGELEEGYPVKPGKPGVWVAKN